MTPRPVIFRIHAIQRMFERRISEENVWQVLQSGEMIEDYSDEMPSPGGLIMGRSGSKPLHVVVTENPSGGEQVVITAYVPDPSQWKTGFKQRKNEMRYL